MVYAQIDLSDPQQNPIAKFDSIATFLNVILPLATVVGAIVFLIMLLYGAFTFATAGGDPEKLKKAQKTFGFSIGGFVIMVFAYFFVKLLASVLHIQTPI